MNQLPVSDTTPFKKGQTIKIMEVGDGTLKVKTNGFKITLLKVIGQIVVALLGLAGTAIGLWSSAKSDENGATLKVTVEKMSTDIIPAMRDLIDELRKDDKTIVGTIADVRERVAKVEGRMEARRHRPGITRPTAPIAMDVGPQPEDPLDAIMKKPQQKNIPDMNFEQIQIQAQEGR